MYLKLSILPEIPTNSQVSRAYQGRLCTVLASGLKTVFPTLKVHRDAW